MALLKKLKVP